MDSVMTAASSSSADQDPTYLPGLDGLLLQMREARDIQKRKLRHRGSRSIYICGATL